MDEEGKDKDGKEKPDWSKGKKEGEVEAAA